MKNKIIKKSIIFLVLLLFVTLYFSGCAQVRVMTITNQDNSIDELVTISLNAEEIISTEYDLNDLKLDIQNNSQSKAQEMKEKLNQKIFSDLMLTFDVETIATLNSFKNGIEVIKSGWKSNTYAIGIRFKNIDDYKYYYNISDNVKTEMKTEKHFFYNKIYYYASTMYVKHHDLYNLVNNYYSAQYPELIESDNNELLYTYKTDLRRQHSDADFITKQDGEYYHTWVVNKNNLEEPIMLYYNVANPENFVLVGLVITGVITIILFAIGIIKNKLNHKIKKDGDY